MVEKLKVAFVHPDLGIGGAERLVVDAALGLQRLGHSVDIYTSHHDPKHCFEETRDGTLRVHHIQSPFPRSINGKFHILFAHLRQLHLTGYLLLTNASKYDVYFVDQLSTCIPFLRTYSKKRVVFYCHFPDKLLADGEFAGETIRRRNAGLLKRLYRFPMDMLEEKTTGQADIILANSEFTARVFNSFFSIPRAPRVVYPGINLSAYETLPDVHEEDIRMIISSRPTLLSLNRFEQKKNAALALKAFSILRRRPGVKHKVEGQLRLVLAGGYDSRLQDNVETLANLVTIANSQQLRYWIATPSHAASSELPSSTARETSTADVLFLLNFTTPQRSALLTSSSTLVLLYTPANEHFGIGPVEGMACGLPVIACNSGGPTESIIANPPDQRTGWLVQPDPDEWARTLETVVDLSDSERHKVADRARLRARQFFGMDAMAEGLQQALQDAVKLGPVKSFTLVTDLVLVTFIVLLAYLTFILIS